MAYGAEISSFDANTELTSARQKYFQCNILEQVPSREYRTDVGKRPLGVEVTGVRENLHEEQKV